MKRRERLAWENLRNLREGQQLTLEEVAAKVGRDKGWLSRIERGDFKRDFPDWLIVGLAEALGVQKDELLVPVQQPNDSEATVRPWYETATDEALMERAGITLVPPEIAAYVKAVAEYGGEMAIHAGEHGSVNPQDLEDSFGHILQYEIKHGDPMHWTRVFGECMEPLISDRDLVFIDRSVPLEPGKLVAAVIHGEQAIARKLTKVSGRFWLETLDGAPPMLVTEGVRVVGRILHRQSTFA